MDREGPLWARLYSRLVLLLAVFWLLEWWRPSVPGQRRTRRDTATNVTYWFFTPIVTKGPKAGAMMRPSLTRRDRMHGGVVLHRKHATR